MVCFVAAALSLINLALFFSITNLLKSLVVTVGECHLQWADRQEKSIPVSCVIVRSAFNQLHYMDCDVALLHPAQYGDEVQPICLLHRDEDFQAVWLVAGTRCLREVELPLIDSQTCSVTLRGMNLPPVRSSTLCAGFPDSRRERVQDTVPSPLPEPAECSSQGDPLFGESSHIQYPQALEDNYPDNSLCTCNITVPEDKIILIHFTKLDVEYQMGCDCDYMSLYLNRRELISKSGCLRVEVNPVGMSSQPLCCQLDQVTIIFVFDGSNTGRSFKLTFTAAHKDSEGGSGCGSVVMLVGEGKIDTANYPGLYPRNTKCHWLIEAPAEYVVKLEFEDFGMELSPGCSYDAVSLCSDEEEENQGGRKRRFRINYCTDVASEVCPLRSNKPLHWTVTVGDHDRALRDSTEQEKQVKIIVVHPHFNMLSYDSNIALMQPDVPLEYNTAVRPVLSVQQHRDIILLSPSALRLDGGSLKKDGSGGPLVCNKEDGPFTLYSIVSWAVGCSSPKKPGPLFKDVDFPGLDKTADDRSPGVLQSHGPVVKVVLHFTGPAAFSIECLMLRVQGQKPNNVQKNPKKMSSELSRCTDVILTDQEGMIHHEILGYTMKYVHSTSCHWRIVAPLKSIIQLEVLDFWTERNLSNCHGQLMVYEGFGLTKELIGLNLQHDNLLCVSEVVCQRQQVKAMEPREGKLFLLPCYAKGERPGFDLIPVGATEITSLSYPDIYPDILNCSWTIYSTSGNKLKAVLKDFVTKGAMDCIWDHLSVYDDPHLSSRFLENLRGQKMSCSVFSSSSFLTLDFKTDESVEYRDFNILRGELYQQLMQ